MPHFSMKQTGTLPAIFRLPDEILEEIVAELDQHKDLVAFALASRICAALVIPHHTEYRILRVRYSMPSMWAHLARRADLARNVREVHICERHNYSSPDHFPNTLVDKRIDAHIDNADEGVRIRNICQALSHMHRLKVFTWSWKDVAVQQRPTTHPSYENAVLTAISKLPKLERLSLSGKFGMHALPSNVDTNSLTYPLWKVANLTSLCMNGESWAKLANSKHLCRLLARSPNLEYLEVPLEFHHLAECRLPKLKKLKLSMQAGATMGIDNSRARFLENHPSIEELSWFPIGMPYLSPDCLPNLKTLHTNRQFIVALNDPEKASSSITSLTPPSTPVTAAHCPAPAPAPLLPAAATPQILRPIESLDVYSLDAQTLVELKCLNRTSLRKLKLHSFGNMDTLREVAEYFPNIEWLSLPSHHLPTDSVHPISLSKEKLLDILPHFPNLQVFRGDSLWASVTFDKQSMHEIIMALVQSCPRLRELDHCDYFEKHAAYKRVAIKREDAEKPYSVMRPRHR
ncbi:hypothetical protein B0H34DRAFT_655070 [Crassisporium funariophilum]|nr:hypothetical protein B0H34DRAFT_655070 [Crassisporium funariophilum]